MLRTRTITLEHDGAGLREVILLGMVLIVVTSISSLVLLRGGGGIPAGSIGYYAGNVERWVNARGDQVEPPRDWPVQPAGGLLTAVEPALGIAQLPSPDGQAVAYVAITDEGAWFVWRLMVKEGDTTLEVGQLGGGDGLPLVAGGAKISARSADGVPLVIRWSPDGSRLAWGSVSGSPYNLHVAERDSWSLRAYPLEGGYAGELAWSDDGRYLAISTYEKDRLDHTLLVLDTAENHAPQRLAKGCVVVWAPDSRHLVLHGEPRTQPGLLVISVGGEIRRVVERTDVAPFAWVAE